MCNNPCRFSWTFFSLLKTNRHWNYAVKFNGSFCSFGFNVLFFCSHLDKKKIFAAESKLYECENTSQRFQATRKREIERISKRIISRENYLNFKWPICDFDSYYSSQFNWIVKHYLLLMSFPFFTKSTTFSLGFD